MNLSLRKQAQDRTYLVRVIITRVLDPPLPEGEAETILRTAANKLYDDMEKAENTIRMGMPHNEGKPVWSNYKIETSGEADEHDTEGIWIAQRFLFYNEGMWLIASEKAKELFQENDWTGNVWRVAQDAQPGEDSWIPHYVDDLNAEFAEFVGRGVAYEPLIEPDELEP